MKGNNIREKVILTVWGSVCVCYVKPRWGLLSWIAVSPGGWLLQLSWSLHTSLSNKHSNRRVRRSRTKEAKRPMKECEEVWLERLTFCLWLFGRSLHWCTVCEQFTLSTDTSLYGVFALNLTRLWSRFMAPVWLVSRARPLRLLWKPQLWSQISAWDWFHPTELLR